MALVVFVNLCLLLGYLYLLVICLRKGLEFLLPSLCSEVDCFQDDFQQGSGLAFTVDLSKHSNVGNVVSLIRVREVSKKNSTYRGNQLNYRF